MKTRAALAALCVSLLGFWTGSPLKFVAASAWIAVHFAWLIWGVRKSVSQIAVSAEATAEDQSPTRSLGLGSLVFRWLSLFGGLYLVLELQVLSARDIGIAVASVSILTVFVVDAMRNK